MNTHRIRIADFEIAQDRPLVLFAGPCVIEGEDFTLQTAAAIAAIAKRCGVPLIFKSSFDKANRTSKDGFRGPGMDEGLRILSRVKDELGLPVITDVHTPEQAASVAEVADVLQTPAFLCRQTDFIDAVARCGKPVNIKKGQFLAPWDMRHVLDKALATGNANIMLCERGASFGYNNLVSDMRSLLVMREYGAPLVFDATHSVQQPGGLGGATGGNREFVPGLSRAAVATGVAAVFMEVHPDPDKALSDGPNSLPLADLEGLLTTLKQIDEVVKKL
ncbi:MAG: 3-deoxy-8-phosphooctulonate synthase [Zetaproteobacteria bacterium CG12_big_fil_rev_8_21_14_0_65_55_1124]|nr:MAG: 3-deoxy-8-phosphooctulonate synthase [Zetaproteobacteria bacterium CG1_02_55_237]PIS19808.1 MAG: 3-deoxy-8-phosphooctulonate synthase [Zetaproteobacteria bacterium CG08_land_8_20_14_0_20_55_17]PIW42840.1 MAG: 3-deoxy-8-phosphooctulonate synthase [Zetaproteobacteria bacterium CG12_big_fil_rev_8_21_14_0_65_55_1124]PIY51655.1 MAG: 3-deoxy-8-phosphooctulonate synthase [Zetaproteobacteria bacterium CG_4_10_14_0_8_um_filter_55_43]PIZ39828.1 MAG: 3-deoxy-8-phosphooctulonate synthase [Zetaprote